jgi:hypothetical protein
LDHDRLVALQHHPVAEPWVKLGRARGDRQQRQSED